MKENQLQGLILFLVNSVERGTSAFAPLKKQITKNTNTGYCQAFNKSLTSIRNKANIKNRQS